MHLRTHIILFIRVERRTLLMNRPTSALERALRIPELWSCIFEELLYETADPRFRAIALARCCRVKRDWEVPALKILWRSTSVASLFKLLGRMDRNAKVPYRSWVNDYHDCFLEILSD